LGELPFHWRNILSQEKVIWAVLTPVVLLWGLSGFFCIPAAAIAVLYVIIISHLQGQSQRIFGAFLMWFG
jgi:TRAP-type C4-dicarboxylate transport system permease large subunit